MNPEQQRIELARLDGWTEIQCGPFGQCYGTTPFNSAEMDEPQIGMPIPNYLNDLNAVHELEKKLDNIELAAYCECLLQGRHYTGWSDNWIAIHATAAQRCEAILRVKGIWK